MDSIKISVIIPVYNVEKYIEQCIRSIINQTYTNYEVIVVDDGSTDGSIPIVEKCISTAKVPCRIISKNNGGVSSARNEGIKNAEGEYVIAIDSDDIILPDTLEIMANIAMTSNVPCVFMEYEAIKDFSNEKINFNSNGNLILQNGTEACEDYYKRKRNYIAPALLVNKKFLLDNNVFFDENCRFAEDDLFVWSILSHAKQVAHYSGKLYKYIIHANSTMTSSSYVKYLSSYYSAITIYKKHIVNSENTRLIQKIFLARHMLGVIHAASKVLMFSEIEDLIIKTNFNVLCESLDQVNEMRTRIMAKLCRFNRKIFYLICKYL